MEPAVITAENEKIRVRKIKEEDDKVEPCIRNGDGTEMSFYVSFPFEMAIEEASLQAVEESLLLARVQRYVQQ